VVGVLVIVSKNLKFFIVLFFWGARSAERKDGEKSAEKNWNKVHRLPLV